MIYGSVEHLIQVRRNAAQFPLDLKILSMTSQSGREVHIISMNFAIFACTMCRFTNGVTIFSMS